jgi:hypothetical protein
MSTPASKIEYGVTPTAVLASMAGIDFVRAMFDGKLPSPPILQPIELFDCSAEPGLVAFSSIPGPVRTEGRTLNVGRRAATAEARITDSKGRLLAHATTTCLVFEIPREAKAGTPSVLGS